MCHHDRPLISPCDTRHLFDSDRLLSTLVWTHWNLHPWHTCVTIMIRRRYELCKRHRNSIVIQTTCVARTPCRLPMSFAREASRFSPMTSTLKTQLMRPRREPKRDLLSGRLSALQSAGGAAAGLRSGAQDDRVAAVAQGASRCSQNAERSTSALGRCSIVEPIGCSVCVHASAILADPRARLAAGF